MGGNPEQRLGFLSIILSVAKLSLERLVLPRMQVPQLRPIHSPGCHWLTLRREFLLLLIV